MDRRLFVSIIVSLFAALATGIVLGGELAMDPGLLREQGRLLEGAEREFERLRTDTADLQSQLTQMELLLADHRLALQHLAERTTAGMLTGHTVAIVSWGDEAALQAEAALVRAGAEVGKRITIDGTAVDVSRDTEQMTLWLAEVTQAAGTGPAPPGALVYGDRLLDEVNAIILSAVANNAPGWDTIAEHLVNLGPPVILIGTSDLLEGVPLPGACVIVNVESPAGIVALCDAVKGGG